MSPQTLINKPTILIVDDSADNLYVLSAMLEPHYRVKTALGGQKALQIAQGKELPDLILLDVMMPDMMGTEVLAHLKELPQTVDIPVILLTAMTDGNIEQRGFDLGAVDFIAKPFAPAAVRARIASQLKVRAAACFLKDKNAYLEAEVVRRTTDVQLIQDVTIQVVAALAETRDNETGNHIHRTQHYVKRLAQRLSTHPRFAAALDEDTIDLLFRSAPLHDIGKVGIPDRILLKAGRLTPEEFDIMRAHTTLGRNAIQVVEDRLGRQVEFLRLAKEIAYGHHEKWDGSGYPNGLAGNKIPISARLMAVADVYDALISRRVYKPPIPHLQAVGMMTKGRGRHFDPDVLDAFLELQDEFESIALRYADEEPVAEGIHAMQEPPAVLLPGTTEHHLPAAVTDTVFAAHSGRMP